MFSKIVRSEKSFVQRNYLFREIVHSIKSFVQKKRSISKSFLDKFVSLVKIVLFLKKGVRKNPPFIKKLLFVQNFSENSFVFIFLINDNFLHFSERSLSFIHHSFFSEPFSRTILFFLKIFVRWKNDAYLYLKHHY